jgi:hypothetical protein
MNVKIDTSLQSEFAPSSLAIHRRRSSVIRRCLINEVSMSSWRITTSAKLTRNGIVWGGHRALQRATYSECVSQIACIVSDLVVGHPRCQMDV